MPEKTLLSIWNYWQLMQFYRDFYISTNSSLQISLFWWFPNEMEKKKKIDTEL